MRKIFPSNHSGQATMEAILLSLVFLTITILVSRYSSQNQLLANLVEGPWSYVQGMIQDGTWHSTKNSKQFNANLLGQKRSIRGDSP